MTTSTILFALAMLCYGDGADNTAGENSSICSLICTC